MLNNKNTHFIRDEPYWNFHNKRGEDQKSSQQTIQIETHKKDDNGA